MSRPAFQNSWVQLAQFREREAVSEKEWNEAYKLAEQWKVAADRKFHRGQVEFPPAPAHYRGAAE